MALVEDSEIEKIIDGVIRLFLIPKFRELGMQASGEWEANVQARKNEIWGRDYTEYLALGRPPNNDQDEDAIRRWVGWAGSTILAKWVVDKGLNINPYAVAYKIAREGTSYYPEGTDLLEVLESREVAEYIMDQLRDLVVLSITTEFQNQFA